MKREVFKYYLLEFILKTNYTFLKLFEFIVILLLDISEKKISVVKL